MIDLKYFWISTTLLGIGTFAIRYFFIYLSDKIIITDQVKNLFTFIPASVLPAILAPLIYFHQGEVSWLFHKERFFVLILALVVSYYSKNIGVTIFFGLTALYLVTHL